eukprot:TRINITY_DN5053_c0_g1_i1.p1 TRINITY_DN5053_c0_g1~~TRINITY_DN5053_c0_g1_i1.p1  ORF type:complete len:296 (-),score=96.72 TRINITY_DN5053_c0_g1_i1:216-1103(-)
MGCGGSKDTKEQKSTIEEGAPAMAPAPAAAAPAAAAPAATAAAPAPAGEEQSWISPELHQMMEDYFTRYDLDGSSTINSNDELKQLCTNLVVKLELDMDVKTIDEYVTKAGDMAQLEWKFETFKEWFRKEYKPLPQWKAGDVSESDDEDAAQPELLRQGTYDLVMKDGQDPIAFKLRFHDNDDGKMDTNVLYKRVINDDKLGFDSADKPLGLHTITGTFDHTARTCTFTKSYDVDCDASTKEPIIVFEGKIESHTKIIGTWKNTEEDANAQVILEKLGLEAGSGTFTMDKRAKLD